MATSSFVDFQVLKQSISITDLIPWLGLKGNWHGDQWRGTCPQCNGSDRSLVVTKSKAAFYCFTAKKGGDLIHLCAHIKAASQRDAAQIIADHFRIGSNNSPSNSPREARAGFDAEAYAANLNPDHASLEALGVSPQTLKE